MLKRTENCTFMAHAILMEVEEKEARNGKPYCVLALRDKDDSVSAKIWNSQKEQFEKLKETVVEVVLKASMYNGEMSYEAQDCVPTDIPATELIPVPPVSIVRMESEIMAMLNRFKSPQLKLVLETILIPRLDKYRMWAAAKSVHHALYGGLLYHSYRMMLAADVLSSIYTQVNRELLITGALLHDIGKLEELSTSNLGVADYTLEGQLLGHLFIGANILEEVRNQIDDSLLLQLQHMLASHHGKQEYGAIVVPRTMEAELLSCIDGMDAKMYQYEDALKNAEPQQFSEKIFGLGNKQIVRF